MLSEFDCLGIFAHWAVVELLTFLSCIDSVLAWTFGWHSSSLLGKASYLKYNYLCMRYWTRKASISEYFASTGRIEINHLEI